MITITTGDLDAYATLTAEYEASLPPEVRLTEPPVVPEIAFVAYEDARPCGCVALTDFDATAVVMRHLFVRPAYRNRGVARALLDAFIAAARARGARRILLDTDRTRLAAAYELYRSVGFVECAPYGEVDYAEPTFLELVLR